MVVLWVSTRHHSWYLGLGYAATVVDEGEGTGVAMGVMGRCCGDTSTKALLYLLQICFATNFGIISALRIRNNNGADEVADVTWVILGLGRLAAAEEVKKELKI